MNLTESFEKDNFCSLTFMACSSRLVRLQSQSVFSNKNLVRTLTWSSALCRTAYLTNSLYGRDQLICLLHHIIIESWEGMWRQSDGVVQLYKSVWRGKTCGIPQTPVEECIIYSKSVTMQFFRHWWWTNREVTLQFYYWKWKFLLCSQGANQLKSKWRPSFNEHIHADQLDLYVYSMYNYPAQALSLLSNSHIDPVVSVWIH